MLFSELQSRIQNAKSLDFGTIFNQSIELFKKVWVQGLIVVVLTMALMIPFYLLMYIPMVAMGIMDPESMQQSSDANFGMIIFFNLFQLVIGFIATVIGFGFKAAFYRICKNKDLDLVGSDDYFYFFKKPYLGKVIKLAAISYGIAVIAMLLCVLPIIYAVVPIAFINVIFAFNPDLSESNIVKASFDIGNKKWGITFGLMLVAGILAGIVGLLLCVIGIFVTSAFSYIPLYFIYKEAIGFGDDDEIQEIGKIENL